MSQDDNLLYMQDLTLLDALYFLGYNPFPDQYVAFRFVRMDVYDETKIEGRYINFSDRGFVVSGELTAEDLNATDWIISKTRIVDGKVQFDIPTYILK